MKNNLLKDYFDCPHCGVKNIIYKEEAKVSDMTTEELTDGGNVIYRWRHHIIRCKREECEKLTYIKIRESYYLTGNVWTDFNEEGRIIEIQYPSGSAQLPEYIPANIRSYFREAINAHSFGLKSSASVMCRKTIYEICDNKNVQGSDYKEKIKNLGFDKRITDPLLNIKNIGDDTVHAKGWDETTIEKAIDALGIIIDMIYSQEERIKDFSKHYSKVKQENNKDAS